MRLGPSSAVGSKLSVGSQSQKNEEKTMTVLIEKEITALAENIFKKTKNKKNWSHHVNVTPPYGHSV